jgi:hypothetical protein
LWRETNIRNFLPWEDIADEVERLLAFGKGSPNAANNTTDGEQENNQEVDRDETDSYDKVIFGRRRTDSVVVDCGRLS